MKTVNVNQTFDTQILSMNELYQLIPELETYREQQFKNYKELLMTLIPLIEKSGNYEFVQLIPQSSKDGIIFIVRERKCNVILNEEIISPPKIKSVTTHITKTNLEQHTPEKHEYTVDAINLIQIPEIRKIDEKKLFEDKLLW